MKTNRTNRFLGLLRRFFSASAIVMSFFGLAQGATNTWTGATDTNWDTTTPNWTSPTAWVNADAAVFNPGAGTISLAEDITISGLTMTGASDKISIGSGRTLFLDYPVAVPATSGGWGSKMIGSGTLRLNSAQAVNGSANWGPNTTASNPFTPAFTGTLQVDKGRIDLTPAGFGGISNMVIKSGAQFLSWTGTYPQPFTLTGDGWGESGQPGALRVAGGSVAVFTGNITLDGGASLNSQDGNSRMTLEGVISGTGPLTKSSNAGWLTLQGAASNTFSGPFNIQTVGGTGTNTHVFFGKTGGAVAIPAGTVVNFGSGTLTGQVNLRMLQSNQFGSNVRMNFNNPTGQWSRFDLMGTSQTLMAITTGNPTTQGGGVIQNREVSNTTAFRPLSVLTLTGNIADDPNYPVGGYVYNGHIRDSDNATAAGTNQLALVKNGDATLSLYGTVISYTGGTTVNNGKLILGAGGANGTIRGTLTVNAPGTLDYAGQNSFGYTAGSCVNVINAVDTTIGGANFNNHFYNNFALNLTGSTLVLGGVTATGNAPNNEFSNATITVNSSPNQSKIELFPGNIEAIMRIRDTTPMTFNVADGAQAVDFLLTAPLVTQNTGSIAYKTGAGTMALGGDRDNSSTVVAVNAGTLILDKVNSGTIRAAAGISNIAAGATLQLAGTGTDQIYGLGTGTIGRVAMSGGTLDFNGRSESWDRLDGSGSITNTATATTSIMTLGENNGSSVFTGTVTDGAGAMGITKIGTGSITLSGANNYTGATTVNAGTLILGGTTSGALVAANGTTLATEVTAPTVDLNSTATTGNINLIVDPATTSALTATGAMTVTGPITVSLASGGFTSGVPFKVLGFGSAAGVWDETNFSISNPGNYRGAVFAKTATSVTLEMTGATLSWDNLVANGSTGDSKWDTNGSTNFWDGAAADIFAWADKVTFGDRPGAPQTVSIVGANQPSSLTVNSQYSYTFNDGGSGAIAGPTSLVKSGSGALTINTTNTYTGGTQLTSGNLTVGANGALGSGLVTIGTGTTLVLGHVTGLGSAPVQFTGGTLQHAVGIAADAGANFKGSTVPILVDTNGESPTYAGAIDASNTGGFTKLGAGTLTLSGANAYTGTVTVGAGTLRGNSDAAFGAVPASPTAGAIVLNGTTLAIGGGYTLNANRGIAISSGAVIDTSVTGGNPNIAGKISGTGGFIAKANGNLSNTGGGDGSHTLITNQANDFTGDITITSGLVKIESGFGDPANKIILDGGGILDTGTNTTLTRTIVVGAANGIYRTYGGVTTSNLAGPLISAVPGVKLTRTDGGTCDISGPGSGFEGTFQNDRGNFRLNSTDWQNTDFIHCNGTMMTITKTGVTTNIKSLTNDRDVTINPGARLNIVSGTFNVAAGEGWNNFWVQGNGTLTSSSGTLNLDYPVSYETQGDQAIRVVIEDYNASTPLKVVKTGIGAIAQYDRANTYTGGTDILGGRVNSNNIASFGSGLVTIANGGQAFLNAAGVYQNSFIISGLGSSEAAGQLGAIRFNNNTIAGSVTVDPAGSRLVGYTNNAAGTILGGLKGSGALEINSTFNTNYNGIITIRGDSSTYSGAITVSQGRLNLYGPASCGGLSTNDGTTFNGEPTATGNITLGSGAGTNTLFINPGTSGALTTAGTFAVNGKVMVNLDGPVTATPVKVVGFGSSAVVDTNFELVNVATYRPGSGVFTVNANDVTMSLVKASLEWTGTKTAWDINVTDSFRDTTTLAAEKFYSGDDVLFGDLATTAQTIAITGTVQPSSFTVNSAQNYTFTGGSISGGAMVMKSGLGILTLGQANSYTGGALISQGEIRSGNGTAMGSGTSTITLGDAGTGANNIAFLSTGAQTILNNIVVTNNGTGAVTLGAVVGAGGLHQYNGNVTMDRPVTINGSGDRTTFIGKFTGNVGTITIGGAVGSRVTLANNTNDFVGSLVVNSGVIYQNDGATVLPDTTDVMMLGSATFRLNNANEAIDALNGTGTVTNIVGGNTLTVGAGNASGTFAGNLVNGTGALSIIKAGTGTQYLTGANTHTGNMTVNGGTLVVSPSATAVGTTTVADGTTLGIGGAAGGTWNTTNLILGATTGATLSIGNFASGTNPLVNTTALTTNGMVMVNVSGSSFQTGTYPLIRYTGTVGGAGTGAFMLGTLPSGVVATLVNNPTNSTIDLNITAVNPLVWDGDVTADWDVDTTANWQVGPTPTKYLMNDMVLFNDAATGSTAVSLNVAVTPGNVTFANATKNYTVSGSGSIGGTTGVTKSGAGAVTLATANAYLGATTVNGGTLTAGNASAFGPVGSSTFAFGPGSTGKLQLNGYSQGAISLNTDATTPGNPVIESGSGTAGTDLLTVTNLVANTYAGVLQDGSTRSLALTKEGSGTLVLGGSASNTYTGTTKLNVGVLGLAKTAGNYAIPGLVIADNFASPDIYATVDNQFAPGSVLQIVNNAGDHVRLELLGTTQTLAGVDNTGMAQRGVIQHREQVTVPDISPLSTLILNGSGSYRFDGYLRDTGGKVALGKQGTGTQTLVGTVIDYTGQTTVGGGKLLYLDLDDCHSAGIAIAAGTTVEFSNAVRNFARFTNTVISGNGTFVKSGPSTLTVGNSGGKAMWTMSGGLIDVQGGTFVNDYADQATTWVNNKASMNIAAGATVSTVGGNLIFVDALTGGGTLQNTANWGVGVITVGTNGGSGDFSGVAKDNGGVLAITKVGAGTQTLSGVNTYTGATAVNGGTLVVNGSLAAGSAVTVATGATLAGSGVAAGTVTVQTGGVVAPGNGSIDSLDTGAATLAGTYQCEIGATTSDLVVVNGNLNVEGATLAFSTVGTPTAASYVIATYTGTLSGNLAGVTGLPAGYALDTTTVGQIKVVAASGYGSWAAAKGLDGTNNGPGQDPDNDGVSNLMEFYLDGNPLASDSSILPDLGLDATYLTLTFKRRDDAETDVTSQAVQFGGTLTTWTPAVIGAASTPADANGVIVTVTENGADPDDVIVQIPRSHAVAGKLFGRLQVIK